GWGMGSTGGYWLIKWREGSLVGRGGEVIHSSPAIENVMQVFGIIITSVLAAMFYGIIHDQVTARICVEYFTIGHPRLIDSDSPGVLGLFWGVVAT
ncbi:MAG: hypothetical protein O3A92_14920, partial [Verrucomicrobia bacterium]|nr:hypothetical protein [Verrucomicrobiota bacterium]